VFTRIKKSVEKFTQIAHFYAVYWFEIWEGVGED
jgi:hypothetical protein